MQILSKIEAESLQQNTNALYEWFFVLKAKRTLTHYSTDFLVSRLFLFISFINFFIFDSLYLLVSYIESQNRGTRVTHKKYLKVGETQKQFFLPSILLENMPNSALTSRLAQI